mgnify:CR=1 FL=1
MVIRETLSMHLERGVIRSQLIQLRLKLFDFCSQRVDPLISILPDLVDADDLTLDALGLLEQRFVHLLHLVTLHHVLLLQRSVLF